MDWIAFAVGLALGAVIGLVLARIWRPTAAPDPGTVTLKAEELRSLETAKIAAESRLRAAEEERGRTALEFERQSELQAAGHARQLATVAAEKTELAERVVLLERQAASFLAEKTALAQRLEEQKQELLRIQGQMTSHFENLSNRIHQEQATRFREESEKNLATLLVPLKERLTEFQKKVEETYQNEARERFALKSEIERIIKTNEQMSVETTNLTRALKGDVKAQGNWGEFVLELILERSGLRKGEEYVIQGVEMGLKDEEGRLQKPDIVVHLPEGRHMIIDSKVSLTHYDQLIAMAEAEPRQNLTRELVSSIRAHVGGLSAKRYQDLHKLNVPDMVLMFVPIEGAFSLAVQADRELCSEAWEKSVVIVSPTTLLATLRTVASVWKLERQNKNALEIAKRGGLLFDKFVEFARELEKVGERIQEAGGAFEAAMGKLKTGRGNILSNITKLQELGAKATKLLPVSLIESDELGERAEKGEIGEKGEKGEKEEIRAVKAIKERKPEEQDERGANEIVG